MSCRKVVIIDDEPIICNLIKRLGEWDRLNLEIVGSATDGLEGYRLIRELHPDIVLLDIRMPGLDGLELIEKCSEEKLTPRFIIISGYQEFEYAKKAIHFNISDYLVKPIDREELNMALKKSCLAIEEAQQKQTALQSLQMTIKVCTCGVRFLRRSSKGNLFPISRIPTPVSRGRRAHFPRYVSALSSWKRRGRIRSCASKSCFSISPPFGRSEWPRICAGAAMRS